MESVPEVDIDPEGKFKYILVKVTDPKNNAEKFIVRGYKRCGYHADIFYEVEASIGTAGLKACCTGGGRILHDSDNKTLKVFGYSTGFGKADHSKSVEILKRRFPDYEIDWSDDGY